MSNRSQSPSVVLLLLSFPVVFAIGCASSPREQPEVDRVTHSRALPWADFRSVLLAEGWPPTAVDEIRYEVKRLDRVLRKRTVHRGEEIELGHLMLASGALYPYHSHAAPEVHLVVAGEAEWTADGETRRVGPGSSIYHAPYSEHRWVTTSPDPLRTVYARWLPDGERAGLLKDGLRRRGGSSTGAFFPGERRSRTVLPTQLVVPIERPRGGGPLDEMREARLAARAGEPKRAIVRTFFDSVGIPWNTETPGLRWRLVVALADFEWGELEIERPERRGARRTLAPSGVPGLFHVLAGRARLRVEGERWSEVSAGTSFAFRSGEPLEVEFDDEGETLRALWLRWAPEGDRSYRARDFFLTEPVPASERGIGLPADPDFFEPPVLR